MSTDLRDLMLERSQGRPSAPDAARVAQVHRRIVRIRRRRTAATSGVAVLAAVAALAAVTLLPGRADAPTPPAVSPTGFATIDGFPEYSRGGHVVATAVADLPQPVLTLTFAPRAIDLRISMWCDPGLTVELRVNGDVLVESVCGPTPVATSFDRPAELFQRYGLEVGLPATFTMTPSDGATLGNKPPSPATNPSSGRYALAVLEAVDFASYPLPMRPDVLRPLTVEIGDTPVVGRVDSDPADPQQSMSTTVTYTETLQGRIASQTPGFLKVLVNGVHVLTHETWDYDAVPMLFFFDFEELTLTDGDEITVTVEPEHVTGGWSLFIHEPV